jgi:hypothetical protein
MNNDVRQTQYKDYVERKRLHQKQRDLDARLRIAEKGKGAITQDESQEQDKSEDTFSFGKWNEGLIRLKRIYNFLCSMLVYAPFALCFVYTLWHFYAFSGTNLLMICHSASSLFSAIFVFQKSYTRNILGIGRNKS